MSASAEHDVVTVEMVDPLGQIIRECAYTKRLPRASIALTFAFALRQEPSDAPQWKAAMKAVLDRYGMKGFNAIKELGWAYAEGRKTPGEKP